MQPTDDSTLLSQYLENPSDEAFAALVTRHINLVYSVALRKVGNPHHAEEITQAVFIILAKKARELRHDKALSSWLFRATHLTANNFARSEMRRHAREQEAHMQSVLNESETDIWTRISPLLDTAVAGLNEKDRRAIVLRFYEGRNLREVGVALGASEEAAKKRVARALEKLREFFLKRGVASTTVIIAGVISANSVQAAPVALATSISSIAVAKGAAISGSTLTLIKGALKVMAWTKMKTAVVAGAAVLLATGATTVVIVTHGDSSEFTKKGWELLQAGQRDEAVKMFNKAVKRDPKNPEAWNGLGWASFNSGKSKEAERDFQEVISLSPEHPAALNGLGQLYLSQKRYDEAETLLLKAKQAPAAWFGLARLYLIQGKFEQAEEWAQNVVDSGQADEIAKQMLQAAKDKQVSNKLRLMIEPR